MSLKINNDRECETTILVNDNIKGVFVKGRNEIIEELCMQVQELNKKVCVLENELTYVRELSERNAINN